MSRCDNMNIIFSFKYSSDGRQANISCAKHLGRDPKRKCTSLFLNRNTAIDSQRQHGPEIVHSRVSFQTCNLFEEARLAVIQQ